MGSGGTRDSRRRRVLSDESRLGLSVVGCAHAADSITDAAPRYGEQARIENHPQASDFVPRRKRIVLAAAVFFIGLAAGAEALLRIQPDAPTGIPGVAARDLHAIASGVVDWATVIAGVAGFGACRLIYSIRRHRLDDRRGNYRVWRWAAICCLLWPLSAIVGAHRVAAQAAGAAANANLLAGGAEWWLAPGLLIGAWIAYRLHVEMRESRGSWSLLIAGAICYAMAAVGACGWLPAAWGEWTLAASRTLPLVGHALALASLAGFARYVVFDVQGLVQRSERRKRSRRSAEQAEKRVDNRSSAKTDTAADHNQKPTIADRKHATPRISTVTVNAAADESKHRQWIGGNEDEGSEDEGSEDKGSDDHPPRKLTKAERKRLRNQQRMDRRAA